ncbi:DNA mismatch repair protein MutS [Flavobacteriaceae bacterium F89]|uniref:DNA mismatch repair protein MutS n=1 Tax=Cerina litoralis TaxID=2874477 RepID=A0AAE3EX07_9FLAO|nr:DNA mismatch repair protein MutS [Cerina litoralis]MCG2462650.1 DNA mismatch repair protein MutS [Cerina litoralis]
MDSPSAFFNTQITSFEAQMDQVKKQLSRSSMLRLAIFLIAVFGLYLALGNTKWVLGIIFITLIIFLFLVSRHSDLQYRRDKLLILIKINKTEIEVLNRNFHQLPEGNEYKDPLHFFSQDIDLFGKGSFYQYLNRTALSHGSETLASLFTGNCKENIVQKQEAIKELAKMPAWRQDFSALAGLIKTDVSTPEIARWAQKYTPFVPKTMKWLPTVFSILSLGFLIGYFMDALPGSAVIIWLLIGLGISGLYLKWINKLSSETDGIRNTFRQYQKLIFQIEQTQFSSDLLTLCKHQILHKEKKISTVVKEFSKILDALDQRNNMIFGVLGNGFLLWDLRQCFRLERWIHTYGNDLEQWFNAIAFFDAYNSLGNFAFNHPHYSFPTLTDGDTVLKSTQAGHPLLDPKKSILNDIQIDKEQFFIITGANMAGKSTFLRTVSLQIVMANMGLPVCAYEVAYSPIKLITSMRTTDSLTDDESYFFSELKRLKFIVDEIQNDCYFIVLDEILKGTNSTDKAIGSRKFVEKLIGSKSTGLIATHDLSLCEVAKALPEVKNYYFDAEIVDNELHFDYSFKKGICQNMNASFLLKKMGIVE